MLDIVVDTSAVLAVLLNEPSRPALIAATQGYGLVAASSLSVEVGNGLIAGFRRKRLSARVVLEAWDSYQTMQVRLAEVNLRNALDIAMDFGLYAYDGYVLETARAGRLPLLTLDQAVARATPGLGIKLVEINP